MILLDFVVNTDFRRKLCAGCVLFIVTLHYIHFVNSDRTLLTPKNNMARAVIPNSRLHNTVNIRERFPDSKIAPDTFIQTTNHVEWWHLGGPLVFARSEWSWKKWSSFLIWWAGSGPVMTEMWPCYGLPVAQIWQTQVDHLSDHHCFNICDLDIVFMFNKSQWWLSDWLETANKQSVSIPTTLMKLL